MNRFDCEKFDRIINNDIGGFDTYKAVFESEPSDHRKYLELVVTNEKVYLAIYNSMFYGRFEGMIHYSSYQFNSGPVMSVQGVKKLFMSEIKHYLELPDNIEYSDIEFYIKHINGLDIWLSQGKGKHKYTLEEIFSVIESCFTSEERKNQV